MKEKYDDYFTSKEEPLQSCLLALRHIILETDTAISEDLKWNIPCFSYKHKMLCFLNIEKRSNIPYILFVNGDEMDHPQLEQGERKQMKIFRVSPSEDIPIGSIQKLMNQAITLRQK